MIVAGVGVSERTAPVDAAREAVASARASLDGRDPDLAIAFTTGDYRNDVRLLVGGIEHEAGTPYVVGCSGAALLAPGVEIDDRPAVGVLLIASDQLRPTPYLFDGDAVRGLETGRILGERLASSLGTDDLVLTWPDAYNVRPDRLVEGLARTLSGVRVAGGAAATRHPDGHTYQFHGDEIREDGVSGVRMGGRFRSRVDISFACRPLGGPMRATECHENLILEVDGRPALDVLRECARADDDAALRSELHDLFVSLPRDADRGSLDPCAARNLLAIDPDTGVLTLAGAVEEGQSLVFCRRDAASGRQHFERTVRDAAEWGRAARPRFGLLFDCLARGRSLYGESAVDARLLERHLPGVPVLGFASGAEIAPVERENRVLTYSAVLVLIAE